MALRAYYDGSGNSRDTDSRYLTLAGYSGLDPVWPRFDELWRATLCKHPLAPRYLHMKEAISRSESGEFAAKKGWNRQKVKELVASLYNDCLYAIAFDEQYSRKLAEFSCTLDLEDHRKASSKYGDAIPTAERVCVDHAVGMMLQIHGKKEYPHGHIEIFFDRNEKFIGHVSSLWNIKKRPRRPWWADLVTSVDEVNMREHPGVQAADLIAWSQNSLRTRENRFLSEIAGRFIASHHYPVDYNWLVEQYVTSVQNESASRALDGVLNRDRRG